MFDLPDDEILSLSKEHVFYTWSAQAKVNPIAVQRAKGVYFWDVDDKRYLDFNSMTMCVNIGHGDERVIKAMQEQVAELPYAAPGMTTKVRGAGEQNGGGGHPASGADESPVHPRWGGCQRERHQAGARLHRQAQDPDPLSLLSWGDCRRDGCDR